MGCSCPKDQLCYHRLQEYEDNISKRILSYQTQQNQIHDAWLDALIYGVGTKAPENSPYKNLQIELLLSLESSTVHTPGLMTSSVSVELLHYQIGRDSAWQCASLTRSPVPIKLWGKDFINIQTTLPCSVLTSVQPIGFRLKIREFFPQDAERHQQLKDLEVRGAGSFYMWELP